jgi:hypothetical protein
VGTHLKLEFCLIFFSFFVYFYKVDYMLAFFVF